MVTDAWTDRHTHTYILVLYNIDNILIIVSKLFTYDASHNIYILLMDNHYLNEGHYLII